MGWVAEPVRNRSGTCAARKRSRTTSSVRKCCGVLQAPAEPTLRRDQRGVRSGCPTGCRKNAVTANQSASAPTISSTCVDWDIAPRPVRLRPQVTTAAAGRAESCDESRIRWRPARGERYPLASPGGSHRPYSPPRRAWLRHALSRRRRSVRVGACRFRVGAGRVRAGGYYSGSASAASLSHKVGKARYDDRGGATVLFPPFVQGGGRPGKQGRAVSRAVREVQARRGGNRHTVLRGWEPAGPGSVSRVSTRPAPTGPRALRRDVPKARRHRRLAAGSRGTPRSACRGPSSASAHPRWSTVRRSATTRSPLRLGPSGCFLVAVALCRGGPAGAALGSPRRLRSWTGPVGAGRGLHLAGAPAGAAAGARAPPPRRPRRRRSPTRCTCPGTQ